MEVPLSCEISIALCTNCLQWRLVPGVQLDIRHILLAFDFLVIPSKDRLIGQ